MPPPVWERPTHTLWSTLRMSLPLLLCPGAYRGQRFTDPISIWPGIWLTGGFSFHVISPFLCRPYYIYTVLTPWHSAYATWGVICQFLTGQRYFSYANSCLHGLLFLMSFGFYPQDLELWFKVEYWQRMVAQWSDGMALRWRERKKERGDSIAEWRIEAALLEARHRLRLTSLSLTDWWDYPDIFSFQLKLHYHKDLMLGRSPYYSQGIWVPFCSLLHSVLRFFTHTQRDEIFFQPCMYYPFARLHGSHFRDCAIYIHHRISWRCGVPCPGPSYSKRERCRSPWLRVNYDIWLVNYPCTVDC